MLQCCLEGKQPLWKAKGVQSSTGTFSCPRQVLELALGELGSVDTAKASLGDALAGSSSHPFPFSCACLWQTQPQLSSLQTWEAGGRGKKASRSAEAAWQQNKSCEKWWEQSAPGAWLQPLCSVGQSTAGGVSARQMHRQCSSIPVLPVQPLCWTSTQGGRKLFPFWHMVLGAAHCCLGCALSPRECGCPFPKGVISCCELFRLFMVPTCRCISTHAHLQHTGPASHTQQPILLPGTQHYWAMDNPQQSNPHVC